MRSYAGQCDSEPNGKHRDGMMVDLARMSLWPRPNETFDLMGEGFVPGLFTIPHFVKQVRKTIKALDWVHPLFVRLGASALYAARGRTLTPLTAVLPPQGRKRKGLRRGTRREWQRR